MIPIADPVISKRAEQYVKSTLKDGWVSSKGPVVGKFENAFASFVGTQYGVATNSGTSAIHLSLAALGIGPGDHVIVPTLTMIATVLPVLYLGATPIFVDVENNTGNIDCDLAESAITPKTRAIIAVHLHGHPADIDSLLAISKRHGIAIVEDAAEAHGAEYKGKRVGATGETGCFSFYANKIITTGEGGMAVTNNKKLADRMRSLANLARAPGKHFVHTEIGFAYRMGSLQAALGLGQLEQVNRWIQKKKHIAREYRKQLHDIDEIILPQERPYAKSVWWHYGIRLPTKRIRDRVSTYLADHAIETRTFFVPLHLQPIFKSKRPKKNLQFPASETLSEQGLCLPSGLSLTKKEIEKVCITLRGALKRV
ncbi:MAG: DegT/DnrJ/EryC1/StrS family aminotransferase [Candidatus Yanofskybacteria bacterium]|nr:DegT/DnrJ/EryC1/StrS family aminotransferase [Candidatus Yanofskybacteria bacterium]